MAGMTPSPDVSPVSAATTNGHFPRDSFCLNLSTLPDASNFVLKSTLKSPHLLESPNGFYTGSFKKRPRNMSQSSGTDREMSNDTTHAPSNGTAPTSNGEHRASTKKRPSTDTIDYPRRRATIACEICRSRKSRCDGSRPKCRLCTELNAECIYREPGIKLDAGDKLILEHLNRIEGLLQNNLANGHSYGLSTHSPTASNSTSDDFLARSTGNMAALGMVPPVSGIGSWNTTPSNISTMPKTHTTAALHLLQTPIIRELVSRPYEPKVLLQLEMNREPLQLGTSLGLDLSNTGTYVRAFFDGVNVFYACVNPYTWNSYYQTALSRGFREGPESCIVLLVLALGNAASSGTISHQTPDKDPPGLAYFAAAWALLPSLMTRNNMLAAQCQILAAAYLVYLVRPVEAWNILSGASMKLQLLLSAPGRLSPAEEELSKRVYWNAAMIESDLLAELDLPHSGIEQFEDTFTLPTGFEDVGADALGRDELWYFLAEIALRRLLNRVSSMLYIRTPLYSKTPAAASIAQLDPLVAELDYQLNQWYAGLPPAMQFPLDRVPLQNSVQTVLRLRYFACRTIIFRPYILLVLQDETLALDQSVQENCHKCLEACIRQLEYITAHQAGHLPYLYQGALSIISQTLLVMGATMSATLSALLPPPATMDDIISNVVHEMERLAHLAPSLRLSADIIREAESKRQMWLRTAGLKFEA
ncbi:C6 zinc finger domain-containing protein [Lophiostoma macrostomum CBS 122681]|uniref:C6 zinc finger domain-containing protein n=1 Tax=Lophiostoma macrostomum CBS 122681 TaxID=1314788 RepID=A0A6A6T8P0_9PLEO|nr:C6 zinc finger domain-containing protein [Lophiostoma macrostomum CBS 122681]